MAATRVRRAESKAATRSELLDAARRVFVERGYHGASLELVAGEAGYTKGAVYSAFGSKGDMFLAVYEREVDERWTRIETEIGDRLARGEVVDPLREPSRDFAERFVAERAWTLALLEFRLHAARDPRLGAAYAAAHRGVVERMAAILSRTSGAPAAAAQEAALAVMSLSNGFVLEYLSSPEDGLEERYITAAASLTTALLGGSP